MNFRRVISVILIICIVLALVLSMSGCTGSSSGHSKNNTCKSCGRSFPAGDSGGNYMSIARTGMCKNCYNNYQWGKKALG